MEPKKSHKKKVAYVAPVEELSIGGIADSQQTTFPGMEVPAEKQEFAKLVIPILPSGAFNLEGVRESTRERILQAVAMLPKPDAPIATMDIPDGVIAGLYAILGAAESALAQRTGIKQRDADEVFRYGTRELAMLSEPTKKVLAKHGGKLNRFPEETELILALAAVHMSKLQALQAIRAKESEIAVGTSAAVDV